MLKELSAFFGLCLAFGVLAFFFFSVETPSSFGSILRIQMPPVLLKKEVLIFGVTLYFGEPLRNGVMIKDVCPKDIAEYCHYTDDVNRSQEADAWLYHNRDFDSTSLKNLTRREGQIHILFTQESPTNDNLSPINEPITWIMTYKRDSDVTFAYGTVIRKKFSTEMDKSTIWNMKEPQSTASWLVSNCQTSNKRIDIAKKAKQLGLMLDIFGKCGKTISSCSRWDSNRKTCAAVMLQKYYFYLAFENSHCVDYVTEKFYFALEVYYAVPIVIKREIYQNLNIPSKSFIALDDFKSIEEMVLFLNQLKENKTEYLSYHEWRNNYEVAYPDYICDICRALQTPSLRTKPSRDLRSSYSLSDCNDSYAFKYLN